MDTVTVATQPSQNETPELSKPLVHIPDTTKPRIVIIGGGFSGIELAKKLVKLDVQVVMFDRHNYHTFQPLLYQVATAGLEPDSIAGPLRKIIKGNGNFYFRMGLVDKIFPEQKMISTDIGNLNYDSLIIAAGSKTNYFGNDSLSKFAFPLKQVPQALDIRHHILQNFEKAVITKEGGECDKLLNYVIVGGGPTGVELAGALGELKKHVLPKDYPDLNLKKMNIYLVEGLPRLLNGMSDFAANKALKYLQERFDVKVTLNKVVKSYDGEEVILSDGTKIPTKTLIWAAGVKCNIIEGLRTENVERDRILVDQFNRVVSHENIFAIGDIASMKSEEYPKGHPMLAPVAMQQGRMLAKNIKRLLAKEEMKPFDYLDKGSMATVGRNKAVVDFPGGKLHFGGLIAWYIWMFIHLVYIIGFRRKIVVFSNWVWNYLTYDRGTRLIIRPFNKNKSNTPTD